MIYTEINNFSSLAVAPFSPFLDNMGPDISENLSK